MDPSSPPGEVLPVGFTDDAARQFFDGGPPSLEACDRCGTYADLIERGARRLCPTCDARRHPVVREPCDALHVVKGAISLFPRVGLRAGAIMLAIELPVAILTLFVPPEALTLTDILAGTVIAPFTAGFTLALAHQVVEGDAPSTGRAFGAAARSWLTLLATNIVAGFAIVLGALACLLPGLYLALIFSLSGPLVVNEGATPVEALGESAARLRGRRLHALGAFVVVWGVVIVVYLGLALVSGMIVGVVSAGDLSSPLFRALDFLLNWLSALVVLPSILVAAVLYEKLPSSLAID